jgi:uncharacterized protein (TIGR04222 family)
MNPFDLHGPGFLLFYLGLIIIVLSATVLLRRAFESGPLPNLGEPDPYLFAYLRGGANEAIRVATMSLFDRGLLKASGDLLEAERDAVKRARRPLERSILEAFDVAIPAHSVYSLSGPRQASEALAAALTRHGLLPSGMQMLGRALLALGAVAVLWSIAAFRIGVALERGRHNLGFLIILALTAPVAVVLLLRSRRTALGQRLLEDHQTLFSRLRERSALIQVGGATNELSLLAGIFGLGALAGPALAQAHALFPKATRKSEGSTTSSCGAACGLASCGGSSGSSCGGGGGGGCGGGGCGGCGG